MGLLDKLPTVNKCCFVLDLKIGTIAICVFVLCLFGYSSYTVFGAKTLCGGLTLLRILMYLGYIYLVSQLAVAVTAVLCLVGIFIDKPAFTLFFIYAALVGVIVSLVMFVLTLVSFFLGSGNPLCFFPTIGIINYVINISLWIYFVIVLKSYYDEQ